LNLGAFTNPFAGGLANDASTVIEFPKDSEDQAMRFVNCPFEQDSEIAQNLSYSGLPLDVTGSYNHFRFQISNFK